MISPTCSRCAACVNSRRRLEGGGVPVCFRIAVSRLEEGLGHEAFECELCHARFKLIPLGPLIKPRPKGEPLSYRIIRLADKTALKGRRRRPQP